VQTNLIGQTFGHLKVIAFSHKGLNSSNYWLCKCDCNNNCTKRTTGLTDTSSCGCMTPKVASESHKRHGMSNTPTWISWSGMHKRCNGVHTTARNRYYSRGIKVCKRWGKFENFLNDMGERPIGKTLDRKDNDKGYSPDNCKWSTVLEQNRNHSRVKLSMVIANEIRYKIKQGIVQRRLAEEYNVSPQAITDIKQNKIWKTK